MEICLTKVMCIDFAVSVATRGIMQPPLQEAHFSALFFFVCLFLNLESSDAAFQRQTSTRYHQLSSFGSAGTMLIQLSLLYE